MTVNKNFIMRRSLRTHLLTLYVLLAFLCGIVVPALGTWVSLRSFRSYQRQRFQDDIESLKESLINLYQKENHWNYEGLKYILRPAPPWGGMTVTLYDKNENEIYTLKHQNRNQRHQNYPRENQNIQNNIPMKNLKITLSIADETIGFLNLQYRVPPGRLEGSFVAYLTRYTFIGACIMIIIACGLGFLVANQLSKPVIKAIERTKRISNGDYNFKEQNIQTGIIEIDDLSRCVEDLGRSLEGQEKLRRRLMTDIAHELRTPLTVTRTQLEAIADGVWEATPERLSLCVNEIERLGNLIEDVESLARLEGENLELHTEKTNMKKFLELAIDSFSPLFERSEIKLTRVLNENIFCEIDTDKFRHVIDNLLSNAQRYTNSGGEVQISLYKQKSNAVIEVRDNGIGISEQDLPNIFERFYRTDESRTRVTGGRGVGLALVKAAVDAHGGTVSVQSKKNSGSTFKIVLQTC